MTTKELDKKYVLNTYNRFDLETVKGKGSLVYDENGKEYIDMTSGIGVTSFGLCDDIWADAVKTQVDTLQHMSNLFYSKPCATLAEKLCKKTGMSKVFFSNSGVEANECAVKIARKYMSDTKGEDCYKILTLKDSFHGRTITTLAATGQDSFHALFNPLTPGFVYAGANDFESLEKIALEENIAGIMIECIQGEGGVNVLEKEFIEKVYNFCKEQNILLIIDEVQTGNGRTGKMYSYMHYDIKPDIVTTAKGLGNGLPIGATLVNEKLKDTLSPGDHGSTFGGNPVTCSGAITIVERLTDDFLNDVYKKGEYIKNELKDIEGIEYINGIGLMIGFKTKKDKNEVIKYCMDNGVLVLSAKDKIRLLPALNIPEDLLKKAVSVIKDACSEE